MNRGHHSLIVGSFGLGFFNMLELPALEIPSSQNTPEGEQLLPTTLCPEPETTCVSSQESLGTTFSQDLWQVQSLSAVPSPPCPVAPHRYEKGKAQSHPDAPGGFW